MPERSLDDRYLSWLISQVGSVNKSVKNRPHAQLFKQLYGTIFVAIVSRDENRCSDGKDLRYEFLSEEQGEQGDLDWMRSPCTMLELLVVLARQLAFEMDDAVDIWFWHLLEVLGLEGYNDHHYDENARQAIEETLDRVIWRTYDRDGRGGLFPLQNAQRDQRKIELWYQLNAYLLEHF